MQTKYGFPILYGGVLGCANHLWIEYMAIAESTGSGLGGGIPLNVT
jgi:hypothetical protein